MKFRLTRFGSLRPTQHDARPEKDDLLSLHKQEIREEFHGQLKQLWRENKFLREHKVDPNLFGGTFRPVAEQGAIWSYDTEKLPFMHDVMAKWYPGRNGFNFLPLVPARFDVLVSLNILFLRRDPPGSTFTAGDIDNRIKTIIDALRPPKNPNEYEGYDEGNGKKPIMPKAGQDPFYVLMEDDKQVSHFAVETDTLLDPPSDDDPDKSKAKVIITVELRPYNVSTFNLSYS